MKIISIFLSTFCEFDIDYFKIISFENYMVIMLIEYDVIKLQGVMIYIYIYISNLIEKKGRIHIDILPLALISNY